MLIECATISELPSDISTTRKVKDRIDYTANEYVIIFYGTFTIKCVNLEPAKNAIKVYDEKTTLYILIVYLFEYQRQGIIYDNYWANLIF